MTRRRSAEERRRQVVEAALDLLATRPLERISTRAIARRVGISQPALFRYFRSRDEIIEAVVEATRRDLEGLALSAIEGGEEPLAALRRLVEGVLEHASRRPGVPRLLFSDAAGLGASWRAGLSHLVSMQRSVAAELVRQAAARGDLPPEVDPELAAALLVATMQGCLLQRSLAAEDGPRRTRIRGLVDHWEAGLRAGQPARDGPPPAAQPPSSELLALRDLRPVLARGRDPLEGVLSMLAGMPPWGARLLVAPFRPAPLVALLSGRGLGVSARESPPGTWELLVRGPACPEALELREFEAPEPLQRVLEAAGELEPGEVVLARVPRLPRMLLARLAERGLAVAALRCPDGTGIVAARRGEARP